VPATNPLSDVSANGAPASGIAYQGGLSNGATSSVAAAPVGNANVSVGVLVAGSLLVLVILHAAGFRFAFDVSVGRRG
jgi:lipid-binding SYLF domain-containing protein